jgi:hypothetical protein
MEKSCGSYMKGENQAEQFDRMCKENRDIVQKMAYDGQILDHDVINVCLENGIEFNPEFLEEIGFKL